MLGGDEAVVEELHEHGVRVRPHEMDRPHGQLEHRVVRRAADGDVEVQVDGEDVVDRRRRRLERLDRRADRREVVLVAHLGGAPDAALLDPRACVVDLTEAGAAGARPERERLRERRREHIGVRVADEGPARRPARGLHELRGREELHRLADRPPAHAVLLGQVDLARQTVAGGEVAAQDAHPDLVGDLLRSARGSDGTGLESGGWAGIGHAPIVRPVHDVDRRSRAVSTERANVGRFRFDCVPASRHRP